MKPVPFVSLDALPSELVERIFEHTVENLKGRAYARQAASFKGVNKHLDAACTAVQTREKAALLSASSHSQEWLLASMNLAHLRSADALHSRVGQPMQVTYRYDFLSAGRAVQGGQGATAASLSDLKSFKPYPFRIEAGELVWRQSHLDRMSRILAVGQATNPLDDPARQTFAAQRVAQADDIADDNQRGYGGFISSQCFERRSIVSEDGQVSCVQIIINRLSQKEIYRSIFRETNEVLHWQSGGDGSLLIGFCHQGHTFQALTSGGQRLNLPRLNLKVNGVMPREVVMNARNTRVVRTECMNRITLGGVRIKLARVPEDKDFSTMAWEDLYLAGPKSDWNYGVSTDPVWTRRDKRPEVSERFLALYVYGFATTAPSLYEGGWYPAHHHFLMAWDTTTGRRVATVELGEEDNARSTYMLLSGNLLAVARTWGEGVFEILNLDLKQTVWTRRFSEDSILARIVSRGGRQRTLSLSSLPGAIVLGNGFDAMVVVSPDSGEKMKEVAKGNQHANREDVSNGS